MDSAHHAVTQNERQRSGDSELVRREARNRRRGDILNVSGNTRKRQGRVVMLCACSLRNACFEGRRKEPVIALIQKIRV